eukprot:gene13627-15048_t
MNNQPNFILESSISCKRHVVDRLLFNERCLEEIEFIEKEKSSYLKYYADSILPTLERKKESCVEILLKSRQADSRNSSDNIAPMETSNSETIETITNKYRLQDLMDDDVANGVLALINKGIHFAKSMLRQGYESFEISTTRQTAMPSTSSSVGPCLVSAPEVESNLSDHENDYACANSADVGEPDMYEESEDDEDDDISVDFNNIPTTRKSEKFPFFVNFNDNELNRDGCMILYNEGFSQGRISGRNGSNACSFICVLFAKVYMHNKTPLSVHCREDSSVNIFIEGIMRFAMQQGNILYDYYRKSLPDRYCSIAEVCDQLKNVCPFIVREELYVSLKDEHYLSTLKGQLDLQTSFGKAFCLIFTCDEKTSIFCYDEEALAFIDTHTHMFKRDMVGAVYVSVKKNMDRFLEAVTSIMAYPENSYGNLSFIHFK